MVSKSVIMGYLAAGDHVLREPYRFAGQLEVGTQALQFRPLKGNADVARRVILAELYELGVKTSGCPIT